MAETLVVVASVLALLPLVVTRLFGQDAYSAFGQFFAKIAPVYGFLPVYLLWVACAHAKKNGQNGLATLSLFLMVVCLFVALVWVMASIILPGMMA